MLTADLLGHEVTLARFDAARLNVQDQNRLRDLDRLEALWRVVEQASQASASVASLAVGLEQAMSDLDQALNAYRRMYLQRPDRVTDPIPGLYTAIDPNATPNGWIFQDEAPETNPEEPGVLFTTTHVYDADRRFGWIQRGYDEAHNKFIMANAFLYELPRWIEHDPPLLPGKGMPLVAYLTMRQMKLFGIVEGQIRELKMSTIQNIKAILQLEALRRRGVPLIEAVMQTHSVRYAETPMVQSGHRILPDSQVIDGGVVESIGGLLQHYERQGGIDPAEHDGLLARYGVGRQESMLWDYDIVMKVTPA